MAESDKCPGCGADQTSKSGELCGWLCGSEGWSKQVRTESVECLRNQLRTARADLAELLAVIFGDGGQRQAELGRRATAKAKSAWYATRAEAEAEKKRRIYYQNLIYHTCNVADRIIGFGRDTRPTTVCGTAETPSNGLQRALDDVEHMLSAAREEAERCRRALEQIRDGGYDNAHDAVECRGIASNALRATSEESNG